MRLTFLGAAGTVTGSKTHLDTGATQLLVDCGLFQGRKELRARNWTPLPLDLEALDDIVLTHAHIDHSGFLPSLVRQGWSGPVHATRGTLDLCKVLLPDSGRLQEEEAEEANRRRYSKHHPARPLYTEADARACLELFNVLEFDEPKTISRDVTVTMRPAGHIVGSALVEVNAHGRRVLFTGDIGRPHDPLLVSPAPIKRADYLIVESTYGNRETENPALRDQLGEIVRRTVERGGTVVIPSFAVGRTQLVLYHLERLLDSRAIPSVPIYVDSPMAAAATEILCGQDDLRLSDGACRIVTGAARYVKTRDEHRQIRARTEPSIIISASGMASGGRVLSHLEERLPHSRNAVVFVGYQAPGTRGADLAAGATSVRLFGNWVDVRADIEVLHGLSAHADASELLAWLRGFEEPPRTTFLNHGEPDALAALRATIETELGWTVTIPAWKEGFNLS